MAQHAKPSANPAGSTFIRRLKLRALGLVLGAVLLVLTTAAMGVAVWLPVMSVAIAAVAVSVHKLTTRLHDQPVCLACGCDLRHEPDGVHGISCPDCGSICSGSIRRLAQLDSRQLPNELADDRPSDPPLPPRDAPISQA